MNKNTNKIEYQKLLDIENQLRARQSRVMRELERAKELKCGPGDLLFDMAADELAEANKARVLFDEVTSFLSDRSMLRYESNVWGFESTPCLLDDDKEEVFIQITDEDVARV